MICHQACLPTASHLGRRTSAGQSTCCVPAWCETEAGAGGGCTVACDRADDCAQHVRYVIATSSLERHAGWADTGSFLLNHQVVLMVRQRACGHLTQSSRLTAVPTSLQKRLQVRAKALRLRNAALSMTCSTKLSSSRCAGPAEPGMSQRLPACYHIRRIADSTRCSVGA